MGTSMSNPKLRVLVADDEPLARKLIRRFLKQEPDVELLAECSDGKEAVAMIRNTKPDLLFLDVQMPELDGFAVLDTLGPAEMPQVIFTTAYESYAIRAFELHALDYLLKPFDQVRFKAALQHARERFRNRRLDDEGVQIGSLLETIKAQQQHLDRLIIKADGRITFLNTHDIEWIEADDKYVYLHTAKGKKMVRQTLSSMEAQLDPNRFRRIHRSAVVNIERIKEMQPLFNGEHSVLMDDGTKLTLSRTYKDKLFELLGKPL
jgi:two-component system LytT family response regulator